jgi:hypothetical protein
MKTLIALSAALLAGLASGPILAAATVGAAAPDFSAVDSKGRKHSLGEFKGKTVVLEWNNPECPFVKKHYGSGNMQKQQAEATAAGVVWLTVNSGAKGNQGYMDGGAADAFVQKAGAKPTAYLLDTDGAVGHAYGARTTPHMYVIDGSGTLRYMGGIDSIPSADQDDLGKATQYVRQALGELSAGKPVSVSTSQPYGCSVKYGS